LKFDSSKHKEIIRNEAARLGFAFTGFAKAEPLNQEAKNLEIWLNKGYQGTMSYMEAHFDKRTDPTLLVPGARSVIVLMHNYYVKQKPQDTIAPKVAKYAYGDDYHKVLKKKLLSILNTINTEIGTVNGRYFVDSAPVMEREWAKRAGLGWTGKNTLLINPKAGSYYFLAVIISDLELEPDSLVNDHCGTCRRCIEACPTSAILPSGYVLDASKCISYLTIELRDEIPAKFHGKMDNWAFGCDICQDVCPWNRFSTPNTEPAFQPRDELLSMTKSDWNELKLETFQRVFQKSAVKRTKFEGLKRNILFLENQATGNS
jgi:epoxyqueuosine reductase